MSIILSLPPEILQDIAFQLAEDIRHENVRNLRVVNHHFCRAYDPVFFHTTTIDLGLPAPFLEQLATENLKPSQFSRRLNFIQPTQIPGLVSALDGEVLPSDVYIRRYLSPALLSFETLSSLLWKIRDADPIWLHECLLETLSESHRSTLSSLQILIDGPINLAFFDKIIPLFQRLNHVRALDIRALNIAYSSGGVVKRLARSTLAVNSQHLTSLRLNSGVPESLEPDELQDAFSDVSSDYDHRMPLTHLNMSGWRLSELATVIPHFRSLRSLRITQNQPFDLWLALALEGVYLRDIAVRDVDDTLLEYLESYSGLVSFEVLCPGEGVYQLDHRALSAQFHDRILPKHHSSLEFLYFRTASDDGWYFRAEYGKALSRCKRLEEYIVGIEKTEVRGSAGNDVINSLVTAIESLPVFRSLKILVRSSGFNTTEEMNTKVKIWNSIERARQQTKKKTYLIEIMGRTPLVYGPTITSQG
ncbi:hypothetical protein K435DRAFT_971175 [Dendrothele bispora CBS 962.96]|uniref:F-box domain-containing protein n=1 Tax=Dendrothele bispora (strain CBS 962.96) TaxID=1314807 RepID=A0A4S8L791_DENBC|nr:hypothetical protein K435DRAFT_971175 [Dendrothele bispora CBS 962.96]